MYRTLLVSIFAALLLKSASAKVTPALSSGPAGHLGTGTGTAFGTGANHTGHANSTAAFTNSTILGTGRTSRPPTKGTGNGAAGAGVSTNPLSSSTRRRVSGTGAPISTGPSKTGGTRPTGSVRSSNSTGSGSSHHRSTGTAPTTTGPSQHTTRSSPTSNAANVSSSHNSTAQNRGTAPTTSSGGGSGGTGAPSSTSTPAGGFFLTAIPTSTITSLPSGFSLQTIPTGTWIAGEFITTTKPGDSNHTVVPLIFGASGPVICWDCFPGIAFPPAAGFSLEINVPQLPCIRIFGISIGDCGGGQNGKNNKNNENSNNKPSSTHSKDKTSSTKSSRSTSSCSGTAVSFCNGTVSVFTPSSTTSNTTMATSTSSACARITWPKFELAKGGPITGFGSTTVPIPTGSPTIIPATETIPFSNPTSLPLTGSATGESSGYNSTTTSPKTTTSHKTASTTASAAVTCYPFEDPDAGDSTAKCQCNGLTGYYPTMSSISGQSSYNLCGWTTLPSVVSTTVKPFTTTQANGDVVSCASSSYFNFAVETTPLCAGSSQVVSTVASIATAYSVASVSSASAASASASWASAAAVASAGCWILEDDGWGDSAFAVYGINGWAGEGGGSLKKQEDGCGILSGWEWHTGGQDEFDGRERATEYALFGLSFFKGGCVERAVHSAGGPPPGTDPGQLACQHAPSGNPPLRRRANASTTALDPASLADALRRISAAQIENVKAVANGTLTTNGTAPVQKQDKAAVVLDASSTTTSPPNAASLAASASAALPHLLSMASSLSALASTTASASATAL